MYDLASSILIFRGVNGCVCQSDLSFEYVCPTTVLTWFDQVRVLLKKILNFLHVARSQFARCLWLSSGLAFICICLKKLILHIYGISLCFCIFITFAFVFAYLWILCVFMHILCNSVCFLAYFRQIWQPHILICENLVETGFVFLIIWYQTSLCTTWKEEHSIKIYSLTGFVFTYIVGGWLKAVKNA